MGQSRNNSAVEDDDFEFEEAYFRQFYKPLSNLPTPPPSKNPSAAQSPRVVTEDDDGTTCQYLGPAAHLTRLVPPCASFMTPSIPRVQHMLSRAQLPMDIIALAVCILDSLNSRFFRAWRLSFPLNRQNDPAPKRHTLPSGLFQTIHIDSVFPEVIILAALIIAEKFVEDFQEPTRYWGRDTWTSEQINFTERCIMENLGYRILPLWEPSLIREARHDIEMARRELMQENPPPAANDRTENSRGNAKHIKSMSSGHAAVGLGLQLTPAATPNCEIASFLHHS